MQTFPGHPALRAVLATDFLVLVAELGAVAILPWWITSRGGAGAMVAFGITLALASFIVMPAVSPFGDRICAWGISGALALQAGLLAVAMLVAWRIPRTAAPPPRPARKAMAVWWADLRVGLAAKWRVPMERGWTIVNFAVWIFQGPAVGLLIPVKSGGQQPDELAPRAPGAWRRPRLDGPTAVSPG